MALELSSGDQRTLGPFENIKDNSVAVTTDKSPYTQKECPLGFIQLGDRGYYFCQTKVMSHDVLRSCMNLDADPVHPMSADENSLITTHLSNSHKDISRWWIGETDQYLEGHWVWAHDETPMSYTNWLRGEPNDEKIENCAHYWLDKGYTWNDITCSYRYQFIYQQRALDEVLQQLFSGHGKSTKADVKQNGRGPRRWLETPLLIYCRFRYWFVSTHC